MRACITHVSVYLVIVAAGNKQFHARRIQIDRPDRSIGPWIVAAGTSSMHVAVWHGTTDSQAGRDRVDGRTDASTGGFRIYDGWLDRMLQAPSPLMDVCSCRWGHGSQARRPFI